MTCAVKCVPSIAEYAKRAQKKMSEDRMTILENRHATIGDHMELAERSYVDIIAIKEAERRNVVPDEPRDCVLYVIARKSDENIKIVVDGGESARVEVEDVGVHKYLYVGITNDFDIRMKNHKCCALNPEYKASAKFYNRIRAHGWDAYEKRVLFSGLTRTEACELEITTIAKYRTFEHGLNSTPGGDGFASGADHPMAEAVNLYNCKTGKIHSFAWMGAANNFLGLDKNVSGVCHVVNPDIDHAMQIQSKLTGEWFQAKKAYDETPFEKNMPTQREKTSGADNGNARAVILYDNVTGKTHSFTWMGAAAEFLGFDKTEGGKRVSAVANPYDEHTQIQSKLTGGWFQAHYEDDEGPFEKDMPTPGEKSRLAKEKAVVAYDEDGEIVYRFDSVTKATDATGIKMGNISECVKHVRPTAGKKGDGSKLYWEYEDPNERVIYDRDLPRKPKKPKKPFYYVENGVKVDFKLVKEAAEKTRGTFAVGTQRKAIAASIESGGTKPCKAGHLWDKIKV
jgi:hypothetical protein